MPCTDAWIAENIAAGEFHLVRLGDDPVATFRLLYSDALFWGSRDRADAAYVHTLAVRRAWAGRGIGTQILRWAEQQARARGRRRLRLDCSAQNEAFGAYDRGLGFTPLGPVTIGDETTMLFEKDLAREGEP